MTKNLLAEFMDGQIYDIRQTHNGRWIDQKCTPDEVRFVSACIVEFLIKTGKKSFTNKDIWMSDFARENVTGYFSKPDPKNISATDEYNKFFRQPMKMLSAAEILSESLPNGVQIVFTVENRPALEYVAQSDWNAYEFLCLYIEKTLKDSDLWDDFASFFDVQTPYYFQRLKDKFTQFCYTYTPINNRAEAARIFAKVLNPIACVRKKHGTERGRISSHRVSYVDLRYNRENWRDVGKPKEQTRQEAAGTVPAWTAHKSNKIKTEVNRFNRDVNGGLSEVLSSHSSGLATQMHHMFMQSQFPVISDFRENIVALTPTQHLTMAHPNNNTSKINKDFQRVCLLAKLKTIQHNIVHGIGDPGFYDFGRFMDVLDVGFGVEVFSEIPENDFTSVQQTIDGLY